jgi:glycosyltransferase involved in cell wall biosynthesis
LLQDETIVCFAQEWTANPSSSKHIMRLLAKKNRVLWLNSIGTRVPRLGSKLDRGKLRHKLASFSRAPIAVEEEQLWTYSPPVLPLPYSRLATLLNRQILARTINRFRRSVGVDDFQLWSFLPTAANYVGALGESLAIYYCVDEWSQVPRIDSARILKLEQQLCRRADGVFATSRALYERKRQWNRETHLAPHGVDYLHFSAALTEETSVAAELATETGPVIGLIGLLDERIDLELLVSIARQRPDWTIAVLGKIVVDVSSLRQQSNIKLLGSRPYAQLPAYCRALSVGIVPYRLNQLTLSINPIKLREYLSAGLPVVSTELPEVTAYKEHCSTASTSQEFVAAIEAALVQDSPNTRRARSEAMRSETWEQRVSAIEAQVERIKASKSHGARCAT